MSREEADIEQVSAEDLSTEDLLKELRQEQATPDQPTEYEIKLATGQIYKGKTQDEAVQKLVKSQEEASRAISEREWQIKELKTQLEAQRRQPQSASVTVGDGNGYDHNAYLELLAQDGGKATDYLYRTKYGIDDLGAAFKEVQAYREQQAQASAVAGFYADIPEFPATKENGQLMESELNKQGYAVTKDNLKLVYYDLVRADQIQPMETEKPKSRGARALPSTGTSRQEESSPEDLEEMLMSMPREKFDEYMAKKLKRG